MERVYQANVTTVTVSINARECPVCGVIYGLSDDYERRRKEDGGGWRCPNGDSVVFTEPKSVLMQRQRDKLATQLREAKEYSVRLSNDLMDAAKEAKRLKRRAKAGVCSLCHRQFQNVQRHMETKHP